MNSKWESAKIKWPMNAYSLDKWHGGLGCLKQALKGWGGNLRGEYKRRKNELLARIQELDNIPNADNPEGDHFSQQARLECELEKLMEKEEIYWQQRGGEKWVLEGDSNTGFFHLVANGRRRKKPYCPWNMRGALLQTRGEFKTSYTNTTNNSLGKDKLE